MPVLTWKGTVQELTNNSYVPVWDTVTGVCDIKVPLYEGLRRCVYAPDEVCVCFSVDGKRLASTDPDYKKSIWCLAKQHEILQLSGHTEKVFCVCNSTDGARVAIASRDKTARIWDADTGVCEHIFTAHTYMTSVGFSADASTGVCELVAIGNGEKFTDAVFQFS